MTKNLLAPAGVLLILMGVLWTLQGLDIVGGSAMSGERLWVVIGLLVALAGVGFVLKAVGRRREP